MKQSFTCPAAKSLVAFLAVLLLSFNVGAQAPIYSFKNPVLTTGAGTAGQVNAIYRFPNVTTNVDALVKIQAKVGNISLQNIDRTADGYSEAFQPEYKISSNSNAYFEFLVTFVKASTSTAINQPLVDVSALDIDGSTSGATALKEFNRVDMGGGICTFNLLGSQLTLSQIGTAYNGANFTGVLFGALVDTAAKEVMFSVSNANISSFVYRVGADNQTGSSSTRYASLYFMRFNYPNTSVLAASTLSSFEGAAANGKTNLKWTLNSTNDASVIDLEKSSDGKYFQSIATFLVNKEDANKLDYSYTDNKGTEVTAYYRLKIASKEGKIQYSNILMFRNEKTGANDLVVYPSLVQSATTLSVVADDKQPAFVIVTDMSGRVVKNQTAQLQKGTNSIQLSGFDRLQKGNYFVVVNTGNQKMTKQIVVQ